MNKKHVFGAIVMSLVLIFTSAMGLAMANMRNFSSGGYSSPYESVAVIGIYGEIGYSASSIEQLLNPVYDHYETLEIISALTNDNNNKAILIDLDTPGGSVYQSHELYLALMDYKKQTRRPVYCYMNSVAASGGYYAAMAADDINANINCLTGSIGVYIELEDSSLYFQDMGVEPILVKSGENKGMGYGPAGISDEQLAIFQAIVDEDYNRFVDIVEAGRGLTREKVLSFSDGRIYTATQALENGMIDGISTYDEYINDICNELGVDEYYPQTTKTTLSSIFAAGLALVTQQQAAQTTPQAKSGVPVYYAEHLQ